MNDKTRIGFGLPIIGMAHQEYLWKFYQGLHPLERVLIAYNEADKVCWSDYRESRKILIRHQTLFKKALNKPYQIISKKALGWRLKKIPYPLTINWKSNLVNALKNHEINKLIIIYGGFALALLPAICLTQAKVIVNIGGSDFQMGDNCSWYRDKLSELVQRTDLFVFNCRYLMMQAMQRGCPEDKCTYLYRGCSTPETVKTNHPGVATRFVTIANLFPVKGYRYLIEAFSEVCRYSPESKLTIIGDGYEKQRLVALAKALNVYDKIFFKGMLLWKEIQKELYHHDIYIQASVKAEDGQEEGFCNATVEALSMGLPVIVTNSGALPEIVNQGENGIIVPQKNSSTLAKAIIELSENQHLREEFSRKAVTECCHKFNINDQNRKWRKLLVTI